MAGSKQRPDAKADAGQVGRLEAERRSSWVAFYVGLSRLKEQTKWKCQA